jgi:hypothetical protein
VAMVVGIAGSVESDGGRLEKFFPLATWWSVEWWTGWPGWSEFQCAREYRCGFWFNLCFFTQIFV